MRTTTLYISLALVYVSGFLLRLLVVAVFSFIFITQKMRAEYDTDDDMDKWDGSERMLDKTRREETTL